MLDNPYDCDVILLSAGYGKRLGELTQKLPKPLIEVGGKKLIERNLEHLSRAGFKKIFINLHYLPEKIKFFVGDGSLWGLNIVYSEEPILLDTGGAISKIRNELLGKRLLVFNSDIVIDNNFNFHEFFNFHFNRPVQNCATLVVRTDPDVDRYGKLGLSLENRIVRFLDFQYQDSTSNPNLATDIEVMFTGISILEKDIICRMPSNPSVFSLTRSTLKSELEIGSYLSGYVLNSFWCDAGTPESLIIADTYLRGR